MAKKQKTALVMHLAPKTARVRVDRMLRHPLYEKAYRTSKSLLAHIPEGVDLSIGDTVTIEESRPISKSKAWIVVGVITKARIADSLKGEQLEVAPSTVDADKTAKGNSSAAIDADNDTNGGPSTSSGQSPKEIE